MAKKTGGVKMGPKIPGVIKDPVKVKPIPMSVLKKIMGTDVPLAIKKKDGGLAEAIEKVKAKEMKLGGEAGKGGELLRVVKELEVLERPEKERRKFTGRRKMLKKLIGKKEGGNVPKPKMRPMELDPALIKLIREAEKSTPGIMKATGVKPKEMKEGGKAVPPKFKGFSKLPESVQQKMNPDLAEKFGMGGDVKAKKSRNICLGS